MGGFRTGCSVQGISALRRCTVQSYLHYEGVGERQKLPDNSYVTLEKIICDNYVFTSQYLGIVIAIFVMIFYAIIVEYMKNLIHSSFDY